MTIPTLAFAAATALCAISLAADVPDDKNYDPAVHMVWGKVTDKGYHTLLPPNSQAHPVRGAFGYAADLLETNEPDRIARAHQVLAAALPLQVTDPADPAFGIWPYFLEEPVAKMAPPDWNWADFCGAQLAEILAKHSAKLSPEILQQTRTALGNAAVCIRKRDVQPNYTNIAIMGGGVCAAAGELLGRADLLDYGRERLNKSVAAFDTDGGFNEYNSPAYTTIVITECDRILNLVQDAETRKAADTLRRDAWTTIADSFHPATGQWAGPHSRVYNDRLGAGWARFFAQQTGATIVVHPDAPKSGPSSEVTYSPCPPELAARFRALPKTPTEVRRRFIRRDDESRSTYGTTWLGEVACLGSVNYDSFWTQRRPVIAYWQTPADPAVVLKLRFLHDGKDFASGAVRTTQAGSQALSVVSVLTDRGDHHDTIDRPKDHAFRATSFKARYELAGKGVGVKQISATVFDLTAGDTTARVTVGPGKFDGTTVTATCGQGDGVAWVDAVLYDGPDKAFVFKDLPDAWATLGLRITTGTPADTTPIEATPAGDTVHATFGKLSVDAPRQAKTY